MKVKNKLDYFAELIEANSYKFTRQKKLILETLLASDIHVNIEDTDILFQGIFDKCKEKDPSKKI